MSNNKIGINMNLSNEHTNEDNIIESNITYTVSNENIDEIINSIKETPNYINTLVKVKALRK